MCVPGASPYPYRGCMQSNQLLSRTFAQSASQSRPRHSPAVSDPTHLHLAHIRRNAYIITLLLARSSVLLSRGDERNLHQSWPEAVKAKRRLSNSQARLGLRAMMICSLSEATSWPRVSRSRSREAICAVSYPRRVDVCSPSCRRQKTEYTKRPATTIPSTASRSTVSRARVDNGSMSPNPTVVIVVPLK